MEITQHPRDGLLELQLKGRLDANWSDRVGAAIETAIRAGQHQIDLDLSQVDYVSSAGIRVLLKYYKQLKAARGVLDHLNSEVEAAVVKIQEHYGDRVRIASGMVRARRTSSSVMCLIPVWESMAFTSSPILPEPEDPGNGNFSGPAVESGG